ncbi:hypothetical protein OG195_44635 (plasmid) [Streptomyces sp. NBC_01362]|nr:hypothetical protein [Streptomyces sp. NBC_01362]
MTGLPRRRVYGSDHDDPDPYEQPGHEAFGPGFTTAAIRGTWTA